MEKSKSQKLVIDLDAVCNFIFTDEARRVDTTIEETTGIEAEPMKMIRETKSGDHSQHEAIRFELIKRLIDSSVDITLDQDGSPIFENVDSVASYNTLFNYGFYKTIEA